jgi:hypothetical protein
MLKRTNSDAVTDYKLILDSSGSNNSIESNMFNTKTTFIYMLHGIIVKLTVVL